MEEGGSAAARPTLILARVLRRRIGMSVLCPPSLKDADAAGARPPAAVEFHYTQTESFVALLQELGASLLVSTYQANKLLVVRADGGGLSTLVRSFERPMGLAVADGRMALGTHHAVWSL